jgi:hypothetical protein
MRKNLHMKEFAIAAALAACSMSISGTAQAAAGTTTAASSAMVTLHPAARLRTGDTVLGPLALSQPMHVVVTLKLRNEQQLDDYIATPGFRPLTSEQFQTLYAPTQTQAQAVADYLTKAGFGNVKIAAGNALVEADGYADTAQTAFRTSFVHVVTHDGRDAFANSAAVQIPAALQGVVHAVLGLQSVHTAHTAVHAYDPAAAHAMTPQDASSGVAIGHAPADFPVIYGASNMPTVTSVQVGSISAGPMTNVVNDLKSVDPGVTITLKGNTGVGNGSGSNSNDVEWDLDSQSIIAFTGVKQYYFYVAKSMNDGDIATAIAQAVSDDVVKAIDISMIVCETDAQSDGTVSANDTSFKQAIAQGQTFFVSAGDKGADECGNFKNYPAWPASSQYVTAVGGTELYTNPNTTWQSEIVWNGSSENEGTTGGSASSFEPLPSWQQGVPGLAQSYRGVPDIAFEGSPDTGALITVDGSSGQQYGGTSLSAPLATGMWARVLQADGVNLGFASPIIYRVAQSSQINYSDAFHDIISGSDNGYASGFGWDYASGWGSLIVNRFASQITALESTSQIVSFATLPALQVTTPIPGSTHTPGDFNGDGISDLLWFNPSTSQVGYWTMNATMPPGSEGGGVTRTGLQTYNVTPGYFVGAVGDFNGDGYADLVYTSANHDLWMWTNNQHGGWTSTKITNAPYPGQWQLVGAGDVDGDGHDDLLWLDPSECKFGYWTMNGTTVTGLHTINIACGYYPISIGYYTPSKRLSIIWTNADNDLYIWDSNGGASGSGFNAYHLTPYLPLPANIHIMSLGGGYQGQNIGLQVYEPGSDGSYNQGQGLLLSRTFDGNGNQTGIQVVTTWGPSQGIVPRMGSAGYVIAGNGLNNTGVYNIDPTQSNPVNGFPDDGEMTISTGGLYNGYASWDGNAPQAPALIHAYFYGNYWTYPIGWWAVGALFNNTAAPPWL